MIFERIWDDAWLNFDRFGGEREKVYDSENSASESVLQTCDVVQAIARKRHDLKTGRRTALLARVADRAVKHAAEESRRVTESAYSYIVSEEVLSHRKRWLLAIAYHSIQCQDVSPALYLV